MSMDNSKAEQVVTKMLENEPLNPDRYHKLDRARKSFTDLRNLRRKALEIDQQLGQCIDLERMLAYHGLERSDVARYIPGEAVGSTDNYRMKVAARICNHEGWCRLSARRIVPADWGDTCPECQNPIVDGEVPVVGSDLRKTYARHLVGVELKDGRKVFFKEMILPKHQY